MEKERSLTAILPCSDLDASERFFKRLGFSRPDHDRPSSGEEDNYRIISDGKGCSLHLTKAVEGWLVPGRNPFGLYLQLVEVDALASEYQGETIEKQGPEVKSWGMYEFSLSAPDGLLVRVGWPARLRPMK